VHQLLANYQVLDNGGQGYMRLLEFKPDGQTVEVRTYSPWLDDQALPTAHRIEPDQQFTLLRDTMPPPVGIIYDAVGANIVVTGPAVPGGNTVDYVAVPQSGVPVIGTMQTNKGDYEISVHAEGVKFTQGIMLASITQNVREGLRATVEAGRDPYGDGAVAGPRGLEPRMK
jgi:hypothetical protein